ncbi:calcium uptake protein 3, mitochondrial [Trichonephila inaurata madagascariensis]|uniref:Calcium uptake protein 3, mitochondrial n=2 Tax=Trichonephila inaurata madagascariensis TaxID=2747483 RepID=A0A8X6YTY2_9ARAC|nr:calcium uptake protein 3, mitochondrial [Trichonephila inaurata madagascariensis]
MLLRNVFRQVIPTLKNKKLFNLVKENKDRLYYVAGSIGAGVTLLIFSDKLQKFGTRRDIALVHANQHSKTKQDEDIQMSQLTQRERRFIKFASVEYDGQLYMTPQDFLDSVTETDPRPRLKRKILTKKELHSLYDSTPPRRKGNTNLFRSLHDKGIISYTEYLFLLSVLTKPQSGFRIAFNMFDTDGNQRVDKKEFLVVLHLLVKSFFKRTAESIGLYSGVSPAVEDSDFDTVDTTLLIHLFGKKGNEDLSYDDFYRFMDNLQTEVLELEFTEFSRGMPTISEVDFARILLRYTLVHSSDYEAYIERVHERIPDEKGISFSQFKAFCQFLNNLDDFSIAMRMFTFANRPISQEEFHRAVAICTGHSLDANLVNAVFQIFDEDGDGQLSYKEFIAIMRDRLHRGFKLAEAILAFVAIELNTPCANVSKTVELVFEFVAI